MRSAFSVIFFFLPLVSAITFSIPGNITSGASTTFTWSSDASDPASFSIELLNTAFHDSFALANNVDTSAGTITVTIPIVPAGDGYTLEAVNIGDINTVYGTSGGFSIAATVTSSTSSASTSSSGSLTTTSTTGSGVTVTPTQPSGSSSTSSGTASSASASAFNGNGAPGSNIGSGIGGSIAAAVVGVIAGAVFV